MNIFSRLFRSSTESCPAADSDPHDVLEAYGSVLENGSGPSQVADVDELPYPKAKIKAVILAFLATTVDAQFKRHLSEAYCALAYWQPGVGTKRIGWVPKSKGLQELSRNQFLYNIESLLADNEEWKKWEPIVMAEQKELLKDLVKYGA